MFLCFWPRLLSVVVVGLVRGISFSVENKRLAGIGYRKIAAFSVSRNPTTGVCPIQKKKDETHCVRRPSARDAGDVVKDHRLGGLSGGEARTIVDVAMRGVTWWESQISDLLLFYSNHHGGPWRRRWLARRARHWVLRHSEGLLVLFFPRGLLWV